MRATVFGMVTGVCLFAASAQAAPILDGQVVQTTYLYPNTSTVFDSCGPVNATVGSGVELANFCGLADIDFSNSNILITLTRNAGVNNVLFDGLRFFDVVGTIPDDLIAVLNPATNYAGFTQSRLGGGDADTLLVNLEDLAGLKGQFISIDLVETSSVPEPSTVVLLGTALATTQLRRRRMSREAS
jgi:PEP-CTERM motif